MRHHPPEPTPGAKVQASLEHPGSAALLKLQPGSGVMSAGQTPMAGSGTPGTWARGAGRLSPVHTWGQLAGGPSRRMAGSPPVGGRGGRGGGGRHTQVPCSDKFANPPPHLALSSSPNNKPTIPPTNNPDLNEANPKTQEQHNRQRLMSFCQKKISFFGGGQKTRGGPASWLRKNVWLEKNVINVLLQRGGSKGGPTGYQTGPGQQRKLATKKNNQKQLKPSWFAFF